MINAAIISLLGFLSHTNPKLFNVLEEETDPETGELFVHMWMTSAARLFCQGAFDISEQMLLLSEFEKAFSEGDKLLVNLIAVSFVEHLPPPQEEGFSLIQGYPTLLQEYATIFGRNTP